MGLNERQVLLPLITYNQAEQYVDLESAVPTSRLDFLLSGTIETTGANADGTVYDDCLQRLIERVDLEWDGRHPIKDMPLRDLYQEFLANVVQEPAQLVPVDANVQGNGTTYAFQLRFSYYFAKRYMARPFEFGVFPALSVKNPLRLRIRWSRDVNTAGDDAGTGAIVSSGSDAYTWSVTPTLRVIQVEAPRAVGPNNLPQYMPFIEKHRGTAWTTALSELEWRFPDDRKVAMILLRSSYGSDEVLQDAINEVTFKAAGETWMEEVPLDILRAQEAQFFPAVSDETGYLRMLIADGGLLSNLLEPRNHNDLRFSFDVDAPTGNPGNLDITIVYAIPFGAPVTKVSPKSNQ